MKKTLFTLIIIITSINLNAQKFFGMTEVSENLWVDETEITNNEYAQFLAAISPEDSIKHAPNRDLLLAYDSLTASYYFDHPAYDNYPVIGINYENAIAFCKWRTDFFNDESDKDYEVTFNLPSLAQWNQIAGIGKLSGAYVSTITHPTEPTHKKELKFIKKNNFLVNCKEFNDEKESQNDEWSFWFSFVTDASLQFGANGIVGLAGNVAEMTQDKKIVGGSWFHSLDKCKIEETIDHDPLEATLWMGFRCVVTINK